jgi:hypothetical protein
VHQSNLEKQPVDKYNLEVHPLKPDNLDVLHESKTQLRRPAEHLRRIIVSVKQDSKDSSHVLKQIAQDNLQDPQPEGTLNQKRIRPLSVLWYSIELHDLTTTASLKHLSGYIPPIIANHIPPAKTFTSP